MELGLYTFADMLPDNTSRSKNTYQRINNLLEEIELADQITQYLLLLLFLRQQR